MTTNIMSGERTIHKAAIVLALLACTAPACAHVETGVAGGLTSGLLHPVLGPDHLVAMVAVGLWGAQLGAPAIWLLPIVFPVVMAMGGLLGIAGLPMPFIEVGIAMSGVLLGLAIALRFRAGLVVTAVLVGVFALFHGHAHGTELPSAANALAYGIGFVIATGLLHLTGILLGVAVRWPVGERLVRACGALIAGIGAYYLASVAGMIA